MTFPDKALGDLITLQRGFDITKEQQVEGSVPIVSSSGIASFHNESKVRAPGVVIGRKGSLGTVHFVDEDFWPHDTTLWVKDFKGNDPRFIGYFLKTLHLEVFDTGSSNPTLNRNHVHKIKVQCEPPATQCKIAAILSAYDDLIANNQRRIALLEGMAEEIYREWFVRRRAPSDLKGGEAGWHEKRFDELCVFRKGRTPVEVFGLPAGELAPYLSVDVLDGNAPTEWVEPRKNDVIAEPDDVVMLMDGARSGVVFRGASGVVGSTASLVETADANRAMVFEYLKAMREVIVWNNTGSAIPHANKGFIHRMLVPVPRDVRVLEAFNLLYEPFFNEQQALHRGNLQLRRARDALLPRLISGKLKVDHLDIRLPPSMRAEAEAVA